jgi:hypothetical protein
VFPIHSTVDAAAIPGIRKCHLGDGARSHQDQLSVVGRKGSKSVSAASGTAFGKAYERTPNGLSAAGVRSSTRRSQPMTGPHQLAAHCGRSSAGASGKAVTQGHHGLTAVT